MNRVLDSKLIKFLNKADDIYIEAFTTQRFSVLAKDFTRDAQVAVVNYATYYRLERDYAIKRLRKNEWELVEQRDNEIVVQKKQMFEKIHLSLFKTMAAAPNYTEIWRVLLDGRDYKVSYIGNYTLV